MRIWIVEVGEPLAIDPGMPKRMRASLLAEQCAQRGHEVTWFTSAFDHYRRVLRAVGRFGVTGGDWSYEIEVLPALGYRRNVSLQRLRDHRLTAVALRKRALELPPPDVICAGLPTLDLAASSAKLASGFGIPFVVDVQDLWPDVFFEDLPLPVPRPVLRALTTPMVRQARRACQLATGIVGTSEAFVEWGLGHAGRSSGRWDRAFPLANDPPPLTENDETECAEFWRARGVEQSDSVVVFVGSFSRHFNFEPVIATIRRWAVEHPAIKFVLCGEGQARDGVIAATRSLSNCVTPGWVNARESIWLQRHALAGLAPYIPSVNFNVNYTNKVLEYLSNGLPVICSLTEGITGELIVERGCGALYTGLDDSSLDEALEKVIRPSEQRRLASAAHETHAALFASDRVYGAYADYLAAIATSRPAS